MPGKGCSVRQREFLRLFPKYKSVIRAIARKLAGSDTAMVEDLEQQGALTLLKLNPKKAKTNVDAYIRQALKFRMVDFLRRYKPKKVIFESLDARLAAGDQLERLSNGQLHLISGRPLPPKLVDLTVWENMQEDS